MKKKHPEYFKYIERWKAAPKINQEEQEGDWHIKITKNMCWPPSEHQKKLFGLYVGIATLKDKSTVYYINTEGNTVEETLKKIRRKICGG